MKLQVFHETSYPYEQPVRRSIQMLRITPSKTQRQNVLHWQLDLPGKATPWNDAYGNLCHCLVLENASQDIVLRARGTVNLIESDQGEPEGPVPHAVYLRATTMTSVHASIQGFIEPFRAAMKSRPYMALHDVMLALCWIACLTKPASRTWAIRRRSLSPKARACARTTRMCFWPACSTWACQHVTSAAICIRRITNR